MKQLLIAVFFVLTLSVSAQNFVDLYGIPATSGTNTITVTVPHSPALTLTNGLKVQIKFTNAPSGAATLQINSFTAKPLVSNDGTELTSSSITAGSPRWVTYVQAVDKFYLDGGGGISLVNGSGTTANGSATDLGGELSSNAVITNFDNTKIFDVEIGQLFVTPFQQFAIGEPDGITLLANDISSIGVTLTLHETNGIKVGDSRATPRGIEYLGDYSATYNARSLVDRDYVLALTGATGAWKLASGGTLTGANTIIGTTSNTVTFKFDGLGVTQTDGAGLWFQNSTPAANGAQQISPLLTLGGQGWATGVNNSQSVKFAQDVLPVQAATNPSATWRLSSSINGAAYSNTMSYTSAGNLTIAGGSLTNGAGVNLDINSGGALLSLRPSSTTILKVAAANPGAVLASVEITQNILSSAHYSTFKSTPGAHTSIAAATPLIANDFTGATWTWTAGGSWTGIPQIFNYFRAFTMSAASATTVPDAYGVFIEAPLQAGSLTITNKWALGLKGGFQVLDNAGSITLLNVVDGGARVVWQANGLQIRTNSANVGGISFNGSATVSNNFIVSAGFSLNNANGNYSSGNAFAITTGTGSGNNSSGTTNGLSFSSGFIGTSTAAWNQLSITGTVNAAATGQVSIINLGNTYTAAGGDVAGLYYNPTVTSITGKHYFLKSSSGSVDLTQGVLTAQWVPLLNLTPGAHTGMSTTVEFPDYVFNGSNHTWASGTIATQRFAWFKQSTVTTGTATDAYTLYADAPTGSITNAWSLGTAGNATINGTNLRLKHAVGGTGTPSIVAGTGAGTSPTVSVIGTDLGGTLSITTGSGSPAANAIIGTITFNVAYTVAPKAVQIYPANRNARNLAIGAWPIVPANGETNGVTTTTFVLESGTALATATLYLWTYQVIQ